MNKDLDVLFTPWKIGNCEIKNRIVITSMGGTSIFGWMEPKYKKLKKPMTQMLRADNEVLKELSYQV